MFEVDGEYYYLDFMAVDKLLNLNNETNPSGGLVTETETRTSQSENGTVVSKEIIERSFYKSKEVDGFRYQTVLNMIETVMIEPLDDEESDSKTLHDRDFAFKMAFNTLIMYGIIKAYDVNKK